MPEYRRNRVCWFLAKSVTNDVLTSTGGSGDRLPSEHVEQTDNVWVLRPAEVVVPEEPGDFSAYAYYFDWSSEEKTYWIKYDGHPEGEFFASHDTFFVDVPTGEIVDGFGLEVSYDSTTIPYNPPDSTAAGPFLNALRGIFRSMTDEITVGAGWTHVFEVNSYMSVQYMTHFRVGDPDDDWAIYLDLYTNHSDQNDAETYHPDLNQFEYDYWDMDLDSADYGGDAIDNGWGLQRIANSVRIISVTPTNVVARFATAVNGELVYTEDFDAPYFAIPSEDPWVSDTMMFAAFHDLGFVSLPDIADAPFLYTNAIFASKMIGYADGDETLVAARSALDSPKEPRLQIYGSAPVNPGAANTLTLPVHASAAVGDLLMVLVYSRSTLTAPAGLTLVDSDTYGPIAWTSLVYGTLVSKAKTYTQTTYVYKKVATLADLGSNFVFTTSGTEMIGGQCIAVHKSSGTPEIVYSLVEQNPGRALTEQYLQTQFGIPNVIAGYPRVTETTSTDENTLCWSFVVSDIYGDDYSYYAQSAVPPPTHVTQTLNPGQNTYLDEKNIRYTFTNDATQKQWWLSWTFFQPLTATQYNRIASMWKYLPYEQSNRTRYAPPIYTFSNMMLNIAAQSGDGLVMFGAGDYSSTHDRQIVGSFLFL